MPSSNVRFFIKVSQNGISSFEKSSKGLIMGAKITVHWVKPNTDIAHTIAVDETELDSYLSMGYILGPAPGDAEISIGATRKFVEKYVPPGLRYEDTTTQDSDTVINKSVALFEDILAGHVGPDYLNKVDDLYEYWDVIRKDYHDKVRALLDPQEISSMALSTKDDSQMGVFLYHLANIFATKGTKRSIIWVLKLLDVQVDFIRWYEPEFLLLRPAVEQCRTIIKIYVGKNTAIDASVVELVNRLVDFLIDICTVIVGWIYVKSFTDQVDITENEGPLLQLGTALHDCYSRCIMEIYDQGKQGVYGVHAQGNLDNYWYIFGSSWDPIYFLKGCLLHGQGFGDCDILHTGLLKHCGLLPPASCNPEAGLIHVNDTTVRHCGPEDEEEDLVYHDEGLTHNELQYIKYDYIECLNFRKEFKRSMWGIQQWPTHMGSKDPTNYWTRGTANFTFCNPDPSVQDMSCELVDQAFYTELHNHTMFVHGSIAEAAVHSRPKGFNLSAYSTISFNNTFVDDIDLEGAATQLETDKTILVDSIPMALRHDGAHSHAAAVNINPASGIIGTSHLIHSLDVEKISFNLGYRLQDAVQITSHKVPVYNGGSYHDGVDRETRPLIKSGDKYYLRLPPLFDDKDTYAFTNDKAWIDSDAVVNQVHEISSALHFGLGQEVPTRIHHDGSYQHGDGNDHYGYDEINFTGTYDWRLVHRDGDSGGIIRSRVIEEGVATSRFYGPGEDPIIWSLDSFDALLQEHHSSIELQSISSSYTINGTIYVSGGPWVLQANVWNDSGIWLDFKNHF